MELTFINDTDIQTPYGRLHLRCVLGGPHSFRPFDRLNLCGALDAPSWKPCLAEIEIDLEPGNWRVTRCVTDTGRKLTELGESVLELFRQHPDMVMRAVRAELERQASELAEEAANNARLAAHYADRLAIARNGA